ncbi:hypothetical protein FHS61_001014 [Altererythrobacter atlanticus]|uniref:Uncharacterized protein n=1 Tax=Croceibacterium atlanticum TaxID=1267766 RepID=A0A0F7KUJ3_9SPHN|nr:hypothetical protein [Croceibacterium atlanticum]AKH43284.1 hypothetical protein WYH_02252 [Croceibacterium atlanticum]MBB5732010.1 hypothetical protein [Croceibacterium atlanticum]
MTVQFTDVARHAAADATISPDEIRSLREAGWASGNITQVEAEAIFSLQRALKQPSLEWADFFVEAISEYVLHGTQPRGHASETEAQWLIEQIRHDGKVCSMTELELMTCIIERAQNVPESLKTFVIEQIEREVLTGTGPTRCGGELADNHVSEAECRILRRVIFGSASDRPAAVSRREAELLFRLKDECVDAENATEWKRLFVQGVGNYLMGFANENAHLSHERMLELERFVMDNRVRVGRFMGSMAQSAPNAFDAVFGRKPAKPGRAESVAAAQDVTEEEKDWLGAMIAANGRIDSYDRALLEFLAEEVGEEFDRY